jgi:hypothetical protein
VGPQRRGRNDRSARWSQPVMQRSMREHSPSSSPPLLEISSTSHTSAGQGHHSTNADLSRSRRSSRSRSGRLLRSASRRALCSSSRRLRSSSSRFFCSAFILSCTLDA